MSKRRAPRDSLPEVDESKKAKQDPSLNEPTEQKPGDPPSEKPTEDKQEEPLAEIRQAEEPNPNEPQYIQIIITGPRGCGKSCLVLSYMGQSFPPSNAVFLSKQYLKILPNDQNVFIWDLDSRDTFRGYRQKSYKEADVALLCFDIKRRQTGVTDGCKELESLLDPWFLELEMHPDCKDIPIILVGLKKDLREGPVEAVFTERERTYVMRKFGRIGLYQEVDALMDKDSVNELFNIAIDSINNQKPKKMFANCGFEFIGPRWFV